jgi:hypothetical protein
MARRSFATLVAAVAVALGTAGAAAAFGGQYAFDGGTAAQRQQVVKALAASSFDWGLVPRQITIHIVRDLPTSEASPGEIWLDASLLDSGQFSWGVVQHEYAHQVDYYLLDGTTRSVLAQRLGGTAWFPGAQALAHDAYGCERFASTLAWSYWQSPANAMKPAGPTDESAALRPAQFKALLAQVLADGATDAALTSTRR